MGYQDCTGTLFFTIESSSTGIILIHRLFCSKQIFSRQNFSRSFPDFVKFKDISRPQKMNLLFSRFSRKHRNPHESVDPCRYGSVHYLKPTQEFDIDCVCNLLQNPIVLHNIYIHCQLVKKDNAIEILISIATQVESKK